MDIEKKKVKGVGIPWRSEYIAGRIAVTVEFYGIWRSSDGGVTSKSVGFWPPGPQ